MIFYFTGTGNSMWTAGALGKLLGQPVRNISAVREQTRITVQGDVLGFVFPTYMNDIPWIAKEFLLRLDAQDAPYCFAVMTSNHGKSGKAAESIDHALQTDGLKLSAFFDLQMPGNCIESSDKENAERLKAAPAKVEQIAKEILQRKENHTSDGKSAEKDFVTSSFFYGTHSLKRLTMVNSFVVTKDCTGCGLCQKICPVHNIAMENHKAVHADSCAACYACVHWCPKHATLPALLPLRHRKQYTNPEIDVNEIIQSEQG